MTTPVYHFDFTLKESFENCDNDDIISWTYKEIIERLKDIAKKYCFQLEESDSGYRHFQGRFSLIKKRRLNECLKLIKPIFPEIHISVTSNNGVDENFYCMKKDTRVSGPWQDTDPVPIYIPKQVRDIELRPWQDAIARKMKDWEPRCINVVIDTRGNIGKSILTTYLGVHGLARTIPFCNDYKDLMRMVMDMPVSSGYIIDMPRAISKDRLYQLYGAIETVKSGYCYDDRYHFKDRYFDCPNIWIFTNVEPDEELLSRDRWKLWSVHREQDSLVKYVKVANIEDIL